MKVEVDYLSISMTETDGLIDFITEKSSKEGDPKPKSKDYN